MPWRTFYLVFRFSVDGRSVASGYQQVMFARHDKRIQRLPEDVPERIRDYAVAAMDAD